MLNQQFIGRVALPIFTAAFPFTIIAGQLGLDICRWWIVYGTAAIVAALTGIGTFAMCNSSGPRLTVSYAWAFFWISLAALASNGSSRRWFSSPWLGTHSGTLAPPLGEMERPPGVNPGAFLTLTS